MARLYRALSWYADALMLLAAIAMSAMMIHVTLDVAGKYLLGVPILGTLETVTHYYMVAVVFLPIAVVQRMRGQIIVDIATQHLPPRKLAAVEAAVGVVGLVFLFGLIWFAGRRAIAMTEIAEKVNAAHFPIDIWPSRWLVVAGAAGMAGLLLLQTLNDLAFAVTGRRMFEEASAQGGHE